MAPIGAAPTTNPKTMQVMTLIHLGRKINVG